MLDADFAREVSFGAHQSGRSCAHMRSLLFIGAVIAVTIGGSAMKARANDRGLKGYGITATGLTPLYPEGFACSPLTSLYASWTDIDGSRRREAHSGVDGGRLGEPIYAPGPGTVVARWKADWGWGDEGALLVQHSRAGLNLKDGAPFYYSAFYHLRFDDVVGYQPGQMIARGQEIARIFRPGGKKRYLPEVHWEVWEITDPETLRWIENKHGRPDWVNKSAILIDPLYVLSRETPPNANLEVAITPFEPHKDFSAFRGFTYILPCERRR
jgi:murein DD-endopeptidase MepM/ murein hydrolase activator NlpD